MASKKFTKQYAKLDCHGKTLPGEPKINNGVKGCGHCDRCYKKIDWTMVYPVITYKSTSKATKTAENKIRSLVRRAETFFVETDIHGEMCKYFVSAGGWVNKVGEKETTGHVKHFLPFFEYTPIKKSVRRKK
jgi:hypothetical protein